MSHQLANLLLPSNRPEIQPSAKETKQVSSRASGGRPDEFAHTLDRQIERQQRTDDAAQTSFDKKSNAKAPAPNDNVSTTAADQRPEPTAANKEQASASENPGLKITVETVETVETDETAIQDTNETTGIESLEATIASLIEETSDQDAAPNTGFTPNPALINTPATVKIETTGLPQPQTSQSVQKADAVNLPVVETLPNTATKETTAGEKPLSLTLSTDLFAKELAAINNEPASKLSIEEAKAQLANQTADTKAKKDTGGLLQNALSKISGLQNPGQNGLANAAANANANAAPLNIANSAGQTAEISHSLEQLSVTPQNAHAVSTKFGSAIQSNQSAQTAINSLAVQIVKHAGQGMNRFMIRMDPPELGRIEVKLEFGHDGRMTTNLTVERPETLDLLQRDARALERALAQSGLNADKNSLNFSLKDQSGNEFAKYEQENQAGSDRSNASDGRDDSDSALNNTIAAYRSLISSTAIDIRI